jgi:hypothetical protein
LPVVERVFRIRLRTDKKYPCISAAVARTKIDRSVELGHPPYNREPEAKRNRWHPFNGAAILAGGDYTHNYWQTVIGRQFAAAIQMLRSAIEACPDDLWDDRAHGAPFWHLAYHALFYADFYLSDNAETFQAIVRNVAEKFSLQDFRVDKAMFLPGDYQQFGGVVTTPEGAFTRTQLLEYADHCLRKSDETFKKLTDNLALERCGFPWYNLNVGEFLLNNLRHTQHHTGQLVMLLRRHANIGIDWLGTEGNQPPPPTW